MADLVVDHPDKLKVSQEISSDGRDVAIVAKPATGDDGKLIGGKGVMFHSMRSMLLQFAAKHRISIHYRLDTERPGPRIKEPRYCERADWPKELLMEKLGCVCDAAFNYEWAMDVEHGADKTQIKIALHPDEPVRIPDAEIQDALSRIWHAAGRARGRLIYVERVARKG
jgi:predicted RNA-binding protein YlqC (UPF0109 family)